MPYVQGGRPQAKSGRPEVVDVFRSPNVFANGVPVALWLSPGQSGPVSVSITFSELPEDPPVTISTSSQAQVDSQNIQYTSAQTGAGATGPNQYYNSGAAADGVKGNYQSTPEVAPASTGTISTATSASGIIPFLERCLQEAAQGQWRETGQGGKPSNPNITGIWTNLGYPQSGSWLSDQTAWCAGFMNFALKASGYRYVQSASAREITQNPSKWGATQVPKDQAQPGDIAFWSYGHVNFVYKAQNGKFSFVGGNQSPKGGSNNPNDGDLTESYPSGTTANNSNWASCWRPSKT